ncbi:MAG: NRDE family protein [Planctomycetaceae bacterium]|nr:NRDE family protein [Planctomycetaceae bacterium]
MGTWLGVNESGLVAAVTNRRDGELRWEDQIRSRGLLVIALLGLDDPEQAARLAEHALSQGSFGGSNFLIAGVIASGRLGLLTPGLASGDTQ